MIIANFDEGRWPLADRPLRMPTREQCRNLSRVDIQVCRCAIVLCQHLAVKGCEFTDLGSDLRFYRMIGIAPEEGPSDEDLYDWGKRDVEVRPHAEENFQNCLEAFLSLYIETFRRLYVGTSQQPNLVAIV